MSERSAHDVWVEALGLLRTQMSPAAFSTWLQGTEGADLTDNTLTVQVPTEFAQHWLHVTLLPFMERIVSDILKRHITIILLVASDARQATPPSVRNGSHPVRG